MKDKTIMNIYNMYYAKNVVSCSKEETEEVVKKYEETGKEVVGYIIEKTDIGYRVWKDEESNRTLEEMKAEIEVEQAMNIRTIKKCVVFFTFWFVLSIIAEFILILTKL